MSRGNNVDVWKVECKHCHGFTEVKREDALDVFGVRTFGNVYDALFPETELAKMVAELIEENEKLRGGNL